jgi:hypothetical protein
MNDDTISQYLLMCPSRKQMTLRLALVAVAGYVIRAATVPARSST